jgi:hypothetical protein
MGFLRAEVVASVPERERYGTLAAAWFRRARAAVSPELDRGLAAGPSLAAGELSGPMGPPGGAAGALTTQKRPMPVGGRSVLYSDRAWESMLDGLTTTYPFHASLSVVGLDERGRNRNPHNGMEIGVNRLYQHQEWVVFELSRGLGSSGAPEFRGPLPVADQRALAEFVKGWANEVGACYAHVTDDPSLFGGTALEDATRHEPQDTIPRCHEVLRGYSWVTVCAAGIAERLGGVAALTTSGAFDEVTALDGGQVFLRATPSLQEYEGEKLRRVFETLAPVLLPGRPDPRVTNSAKGRLVNDADAADFR